MILIPLDLSINDVSLVVLLLQCVPVSFASYQRMNQGYNIPPKLEAAAQYSRHQHEIPI